MKHFEDLSILELEGSAAGGYTGRLFADCGARVTLVQSRPLTEPSRDPVDLFLHRGKRRLTLDWSDDE